AALVGDELPRRAGFHVPDDDRDAGQHRFRFVGDRAGNRAGRRLGVHRGRRRRERENEEAHGRQNGQPHVEASLWSYHLLAVGCMVLADQSRLKPGARGVRRRPIQGTESMTRWTRSAGGAAMVLALVAGSSALAYARWTRPAADADAALADWDTKFDFEMVTRLAAELRKQPKTPPNQLMQLLRPQPKPGAKPVRRVG